MPGLRTSVYVDGFNLYYGALKGTPHKWLDIDAMCRQLLPNNQITRIRYFTALVQARPDDLQIQTRQQTFLRALETIPHLTLHLGTFRQDVRMMKSPSGTTQPPYVKVLRTEEKGSDVNLAAYLLRDCFLDQFEVAVVVSNDTDLITPIEMVANEFGCPVGLLNPHRRPARALLNVASFYKPIREGVLRTSQFPPTMTDAVGIFSKPPSW